MKKHILIAAAVLSSFIMKAGDLTGDLTGAGLFNNNSTTNQNMLAYHGGSSSSGKFSIGVSVGAALPMGAWGSKAKDSSSNSSGSTYVIQDGFASTGFHFDVNAAYLFAGPLGAQIFIGGNLNAYDATTYSSVYNIQSPSSFSATSYYTGQYLVGPCLGIPAGNLQINVRFLVGLVSISRPTTTLNYTFFGQPTTTVTSGQGSSGFGYMGGLGIKYNFGNMGLLVNVDYTGNSAKFSGSTSKTTSGGASSSSSSSDVGTLAFSMITASVGLAFNLQ